jgi:hypothetical protein
MAFITMMQQRPFAFSAAEFQMHQENNSTSTLTLNESVCLRKPNQIDKQNGYFKLRKRI